LCYAGTTRAVDRFVRREQYRTAEVAQPRSGAVIGDVTGGSDIALGKVADVLGDSRAEGMKEPEGLPTEDARCGWVAADLLRAWV